VLPVTVPGGDATTDRVSGELCATGSPAGKPLEVTVAGFTYNRWYWDPSYQRERYSYVLAAARAGFAVFNYDQLGTAGASDTPPAAQLSLLAQTGILHQLIGQLRAGAVARTRFSKVIVAGHSLGAEQALVLGSDPAYAGDADGLIVSDYLHVANPAEVPVITAARVPAAASAKFAGLPWIDGYLTTADGQRSVFYDPPNADPAMIAADEAAKGVASVATAAQINYVRANPTLTNAITVPVLDAVGDRDNVNCNAALPGLSCASAADVAARERQYFARACYRAFVLPRSGHDMNLHRSAPVWFDAANRWARSVVADRRWAPRAGC
jgi:pimeloyl-ACP methyl ester carboxylesterase